MWWPRLDSLKDGIMFAESGVANGRMRTPFKKNHFFSCLFCPVGWVRNTEPMPGHRNIYIYTNNNFEFVNKRMVESWTGTND